MFGPRHSCRRFDRAWRGGNVSFRRCDRPTTIQEHHLYRTLHFKALRQGFQSRADAVNAQRIAEQIKELNRTGIPHDYAVYFVPRLTCLCEKVEDLEKKKMDSVVVV